MHPSASRTARRATLAACAAALALAAPAAAAPKHATADLRVEGGGRALAPGYRYVTGTTHLQTDPSPGCDGSGGVKTLPGPTALGILETASRISSTLRPLSVSDKFDFGLVVCGIGGRSAFSASQFWSYKVDHVLASVGADQFALRSGQRVLWYFVDLDAGVNSGKELELAAPARARSGHAFEVTVYQYDDEGHRTPAAGALVRGQTVQRTGPDGKARMLSDKRGYVRLRAVRGSDVPSEPVGVCLNPVLRRCPARRGERIFGSNAGERIRGTRGADVVYGRGGNDVINVRGGGRDRVRCGRGRDLVRADRRDRVARDCERVRR